MGGDPRIAEESALRGCRLRRPSCDLAHPGSRTKLEWQDRTARQIRGRPACVQAEEVPRDLTRRIYEGECCRGDRLLATRKRCNDVPDRKRRLANSMAKSAPRTPTCSHSSAIRRPMTRLSRHPHLIGCRTRASSTSSSCRNTSSRWASVRIATADSRLTSSPVPRHRAKPSRARRPHPCPAPRRLLGEPARPPAHATRHLSASKADRRGIALAASPKPSPIARTIRSRTSAEAGAANARIAARTSASSFRKWAMTPIAASDVSKVCQSELPNGRFVTEVLVEGFFDQNRRSMRFCLAWRRPSSSARARSCVERLSSASPVRTSPGRRQQLRRAAREGAPSPVARPAELLGCSCGETCTRAHGEGFERCLNLRVSSPPTINQRANSPMWNA